VDLVELRRLARETVHPHRLAPGADTYCQCPTCERIEQAFGKLVDEVRATDLAQLPTTQRP
jgi:hypothetical protein